MHPVQEVFVRPFLGRRLGFRITCGTRAKSRRYVDFEEEKVVFGTKMKVTMGTVEQLASRLDYLVLRKKTRVERKTQH